MSGITGKKARFPLYNERGGLFGDRYLGGRAQGVGGGGGGGQGYAKLLKLIILPQVVM